MNLGFIGVGNMGGPMVRNLLEDGYKVKVNDINREAVRRFEELGADWASTPREAAEGSEIILSSLPGPVEVEAVASAPTASWKASPKAQSTPTSPASPPPSPGGCTPLSGKRAPTSLTPPLAAARSAPPTAP